LGIGAATDAKKPKSYRASPNEIINIKEGSKVEITTNEGVTYSGKFYGLETIYDENYHKKYDSIKTLIAGPESLPGINDTIQIYLSLEKNIGKLGIFKGFKGGKIWYKYLYSDDIENIDLMLIDRIRIHNDYIIGSENIQQISALDFPELLFLKIGHGGGEFEYCGLHDVNGIIVRVKRNGALTGFLIGLPIDIVFLVLTLQSLQDMGSGFSMTL